MAEDGPPPNATLYVRNLNERKNVKVIIKDVEELFAEFGNVVEVIAKKNIKAKGQAFVVFGSAEEAGDAMEALQGFELHDRPIEVAYAKARSDTTVLKEDGPEGLERWKRERLAEKERKKAVEAEAAAAAPAKRAAPEALAERPAKSAKPGAAGQFTDEYLPPNKVLLLRELPEDYDKDMLTAVFRRYPGLKDVRMVPTRKGLAFLEYEDESGAIAAKDAMDRVELGGKTIRVTYQRQ